MGYPLEVMVYKKTGSGVLSPGSRLLRSALLAFLLAGGATANAHSSLLSITSQSVVETGKSPVTPQTIITSVREQLGIKPQAVVPELPSPELEKKPDVAPSIVKKKQEKPKIANNETEALAAFYGQQDRQPIWVSQSSYTPKARKIIKEFEQADAYGLRPGDFSPVTPGTLALIGQMDNPTPAKLAKLEISLSKRILKYAKYAKGGRIDPRKLSRFQDRGPIMPDFEQVLKSISQADNPEEFLRKLHPQHPQFQALRKKLGGLSAKKKLSQQAKKSDKPPFPAKGPSLRPGKKHAHVALLRKRLSVEPVNKQADPTIFDKPLVSAVKKYQKSKGLTADGIVGAGTRRALSGGAAKKTSPEKLRARLLINMERWRWMPEKMQGENNIFVWANVPELRVRIIKDGKLLFAEKVIAGLAHKQSPMFSDEMEWIEFNPTWFIPNSIKVADILPSLRGKGRVMSRYHLRIDCGKYGTDFRTIDWNKVDIRKCAVIQPTGAKSVLGKLKFKFPNKHAVYMHDTLTPGLFNRTHRILSHGCIRIRNPRRMAEVLLANDKGMSAKRVGSLLSRGGLHTERLKRSIPVHITYFSTRVKQDGSLVHHPDYYGHDKRLAQALLGKGHLFRGAIYSGRKKYKRKRRPKPSSKPADFKNYFSQQ